MPLSLSVTEQIQSTMCDSQYISIAANHDKKVEMLLFLTSFQLYRMNPSTVN